MLSGMTLLALLLPLAFSAADVSIAGDWRVYSSAAGRESTQTCSFAQKNGELSGSCAFSAGPARLTGKIEGAKVTWTLKTESEAGPVTVIYTGTLDGEDTITGTLTAVEFGVDGEFKATRSK
jgi:hypothetical protein